ncbi:MAG: hypothetical protein WAZ94_05155, partial [Phycisphaerales bacterium]
MRRSGDPAARPIFSLRPLEADQAIGISRSSVTTSVAARGMQVPTYAYAANNPLKYADPTGLYFTGLAPELRIIIDSLKRNPNIGPIVDHLDRRTDLEIEFKPRSCREMLPYGGGRPISDGGMKAEPRRDGLRAKACQPRVFLKAAGVISSSCSPKTSRCVP